MDEHCCEKCGPNCALIPQPAKEVLGTLTKAFNTHPGVPDIAFNNETGTFDPVWGKSSVAIEMVHRVSLLEEAEGIIKSLSDFLLNNAKGSPMPLISTLSIDNRDVLSIMDFGHAFKTERDQAQDMLEHFRTGGCIPRCSTACAVNLRSNRNDLIVVARKVIQRIFRKLTGCTCVVACNSKFTPIG